MSNRLHNHAVTIFYACVFLTAALLCIDLYAPSLPIMAKALHLSQTMTRGLTVAFFIGLGVSIPSYGILADRYGRKPIIIFSLALGGFGNIFSALALTGGQLLLSLFIAGLGVGGCLVVSRSILRDKIRDTNLLIQGFAVYAMVGQLSPTLAPSIGSLIQHFTNWRMNFWFIALFIGFTILLVIFKFQETLINKCQLDIKSVTYTMKKILVNRIFCIYSAMSGVVFGFILNYFTAAPFVLQNTYHITPLHTGLYLLLMPVSLMLGSLLAGYLSGIQIKTRSLLITYIVFFLLISVGSQLLSQQLHSIGVLIITSMLLGFLCGLIVPILTGESMSMVDGPIGMASAIQAMIKMLATALSVLVSLKIHVKTTHDLTMIFVILSLVLSLLCLMALIPSKAKNLCSLQKKQASLNS